MSIFQNKGKLVAAISTFTVVGISAGLVIISITALKSTSEKFSYVLKFENRNIKPDLSDSDLIAKSAVIYDPTNDTILYSKNSNKALPLASLTKLATAYTVLAEVDPAQKITITSKDLEPSGDWGLKIGDKVSISSLLKLGFVASSNDAMAAAAGSLGDNAMNKINTMTSKLGLDNSNFSNPTGLDESSTTAGAYGSAIDMAKLAAAFYKKYPTYFEYTEYSNISVKTSSGIITASATDAPLLTIPNLVGAKTGYTTLAGGNLIAIFDIDIGHPLVAVVLGSSENGRFQDIKTLITAVSKTQQ